MVTVPTGVLLLRMVLRRAWALVLVPVLVGGLAFVMASQSAPVWTSHALVRLHIDSGGPSIPGVETSTSQWAVIGRIATQLKLFQSRTVLAGAGEQELYDELVAITSGTPLRLPNGTEAVNPLDAIVAAHDPSGHTREALLGVVWSGSDRVMQDAAHTPEALAFVRWALSKEGPYGEKALRDAVNVQRIGESDLVTLTLTAEHRALAPRLLAATMDQCVGVLADSKRADSDHRRAFFEQRVREAKERLNEREQALKIFLTDNDIANYTDQTRALALQIEDTRMRLSKASEDAARFNRRRRGIEEALGGPQFLERWKDERATDAELLQLRESVAAERARSWLAEATWTAEAAPAPAPALQDRVDAYLDGRVSGLEPHRKELVYDWLNEDLELAGSQAGHSVLEGHLRESEEDMQRYAALGSEIKRMEREIDVAEREYLELVRGLNAANLMAQQADGVTPFSVVDAASVPREAEPRGRALTAVMGAVLAFGLVFIVILVVESLDQSLRTPAAFETAYDLPVLGGLPHLTDPANPKADASVTVQCLLSSLLARVANAAEGAERVQVVAMQSKTGTSVVVAALADLGLPVDDRAAVAQGSAALRPQRQTVTVWVVSSGDTHGPAERRALRDLEDAGAPVVGLVINELTYEGAEELLGVVPRPRTRMRQAIKRLAGLRLRVEAPWRPAA